MRASWGDAGGNTSDAPEPQEPRHCSVPHENFELPIWGWQSTLLWELSRTLQVLEEDPLTLQTGRGTAEKEPCRTKHPVVFQVPFESVQPPHLNMPLLLREREQAPFPPHWVRTWTFV